MIYKFIIVSDEVANFRREIDIDADNTFLDLKNAICNSVGYDKNQMCSFFICDDDWEKQKEITMEDMNTDSDKDSWLMDDCRLSDYIDDEGQKLLFDFDYITDRNFFIELKDIITGKTLKDPVCTLSLGQAPPQMMDIDEFNDKMNIKTPVSTDIEDLDEEFYGSEAFDSAELVDNGYDVEYDDSRI